MSNVTDCDIRPLSSREVDEADRISRLAFGTYLKLPDPLTMFGDREMMRKRWGDLSSTIAAYSDQKLVGLCVVTRWGSFGWFGPLAVHPDYWNKGIAKKLMVSTMDLFSQWKTTGEGLFTFADSPKHVGLYQKFGFYPRFLTTVMTHESGPTKQEYSTFSCLETNKEREQLLRACFEITDDIYPGLDLSCEVLNVYNKRLGDTVLLMEGSRLEGFAVCHVGAGTEAGGGNCYIKFGAVSSKDSRGRAKFSRLVDVCLGFAASSRALTVEAGINLGRIEAYEELNRLGFKTSFQGVALQRPNEAGSNRPGVFAIDDWR